MPEPPVGWQGPLVLYEGPNGVPAPACAANHPTQIGDFFGGLDGGTATCGCSCGAATGIVCSASSSACYNSSCLAVCNSALGHTTQSLSPTAGCSQTAAGGSAIHVGNPAPTNMGSCQPQTNNSIPTPTFADAARVCGGAATTTVGCGANELCTPEGGADFARMCIAQSGDLTCLDPFYSVKHLLAAGFTDGRSCSTCGCNPAVSTCGGAIDFSSNSCSILVDAINAGACAASPGAGLFINYNPSPSGTCGATGGMLSGSVTEQGPLTLCCDG